MDILCVIWLHIVDDCLFCNHGGML